MNNYNFYLSRKEKYPYEVSVPLKGDIPPHIYETLTSHSLCRVPFYAHTLLAHAVWMFKTSEGLQEFIQYRKDNG